MRKIDGIKAWKMRMKRGREKNLKENWTEMDSGEVSIILMNAPMITLMTNKLFQTPKNLSPKTDTKSFLLFQNRENSRHRS